MNIYIYIYISIYIYIYIHIYIYIYIDLHILIFGQQILRIECRLRTIVHYHIIHPSRIHSQGVHQLAPLAQDHCKNRNKELPCWSRHPCDVITENTHSKFKLQYIIGEITSGSHIYIYTYIYIDLHILIYGQQIQPRWPSAALGWDCCRLPLPQLWLIYNLSNPCSFVRDGPNMNDNLGVIVPQAL